jgi:hypothetical protein
MKTKALCLKLLIFAIRGYMLYFIEDELNYIKIILEIRHILDIAQSKKFGLRQSLGIEKSSSG